MNKEAFEVGFKHSLQKYNKPKINATYPWKMKKKFQEKKMLVIVDYHIEWDKTNRSGVHNINLGYKTIELIILSHALNFIRMIFIKYLSGLY